MVSPFGRYTVSSVMLMLLVGIVPPSIRELATGSLHRPVVADLMVRRQLKLITHPARYCSRASDAFRREVLPVFASPDSPLRQAQATPGLAERNGLRTDRPPG